MYRITNQDMEQELVELNSRLALVLLPNNVILSLYLILGVTGNLTVIYFYIFRLNSKKDNRYFIPWLAIMDLLACVMASSFALTLNILPINFRGNITCKILWFTTESTTLTSGMMLLVIAVQRYLKVCKPFGSQMVLKWKRLAIIITVATAVIISSPVFVFYGEIEVFNKQTNITGYRCGHSLQENIKLKRGLIAYDFILFGFAVAVVISITTLYGFIGKTVYLQFKKDRERKRQLQSVIQKRNSNSTENLKSSSPLSPTLTAGRWEYPGRPRSDSVTSNSSECNTSHEQRNSMEEPPLSTSIPSWIGEDGQKSRRSTDLLKINIPKIKKKHVKNHFTTFRYSYMFMLITVVFALSYSPTTVLMVREAIDPLFWAGLSNTEISAHLILYRMFIINHVVNPFIYGFFDGAFRKEMKRTLCCCFGKSKPVRT